MPSPSRCSITWLWGDSSCPLPRGGREHGATRGSVRRRQCLIPSLPSEGSTRQGRGDAARPLLTVPRRRCLFLQVAGPWQPRSSGSHFAAPAHLGCLCHVSVILTPSPAHSSRRSGISGRCRSKWPWLQGAVSETRVPDGELNG